MAKTKKPTEQPSTDAVGTWLAATLGKDPQWRYSTHHGLIMRGQDQRVDWSIVASRMLDFGMIVGLAWAMKDADVRCTITAKGGKRFVATKPTMSRAFSEAVHAFASHAMKGDADG